MEDNIAVAYQVSADNGNELEYTYFGLFDGCVTSGLLLDFVGICPPFCYHQPRNDAALTQSIMVISGTVAIPHRASRKTI